MVWHVRTKSVTDTSILIEYSYEQNLNCDGLINYNKATDVFSIEKLSVGADEFATKWLFQHLYRLLRNNELNGEVRHVCIG